MSRILISSALLAASLLASTASAADLTATDILARNAAARGGLAAWRTVQSMSMTGEMDAGGKTDAKLPFVMTLKRPHETRLEIRFQDQSAVQTFDGTQGWKYRPYLGRLEAEPLTPAELKVAAAADELDGPLLDHARKGVKVDLQGMEKIEGRNAYKLKVVGPAGVARNVWVDAGSFLEVKMEGEPRKLDGRLHKVAVFFRDYRTVSGLNIAHVQETVVDGVKQTRKIVLKSVTVNPKVDDALFGKPQPALLQGPAAS